MVVFTCSSCGDAVKKPQVEKHSFRRQCRGAVFTCVDCFKDFYGKEYQSHNTCISENQRYGGKNFVPKENVNKGQLKQQKWFESVLQAIDKFKAQQPPRVQALLERLKGFPNIPTKKAKFESFLQTNIGVRDTRLVSQIWKAIDQNVEKKPPITNQQNGQIPNTNMEPTETQCERLTVINTENNNDKSDSMNEVEKKLNKRERKEQRQKLQQKKKKKEIVGEKVDEEGTENVKVKKKKKKHKGVKEEDEEKSGGKKRKLDEMEDGSQEENGEVVYENGNQSVQEEDGDQPLQEEDGEPAKKRFKTKFDWSGVITEVLQGKEKEIKIKKLRRKVLAEYLSQGCTEKSEEKLWAKFDEKLKKNPLFKIQNDRVKLKR